MPICRTCRGEYDKQETLCPVCGKPAGCSLDTCHRCNMKIGAKRLCPRCKSDVTLWEREPVMALKFFLKGSVFEFLPGLLALVPWFLLFRRTGSRYYYPLLTVTSIGLSLLVFVGAYATRLFWWDRWWESQIYKVKSVSIVVIIIGTGLAGICFVVLWVLLYAIWGKPEGVWRQAFFGGIYVLSYACFTAAATSFWTYLYLGRLEQYAPHPIFVDTNRLVRLTVDVAVQSINLPYGVSSAASSASPAPIYETQQILRSPEDGGILLIVREGKWVMCPDTHGQIQPKWEQKLWRVKADRWGRVQSLDPLPPEA